MGGPNGRSGWGAGWDIQLAGLRRNEAEYSHRQCKEERHRVFWALNARRGLSLRHRVARASAGTVWSRGPWRWRRSGNPADESPGPAFEPRAEARSRFFEQKARPILAVRAIAP